MSETVPATQDHWRPAPRGLAFSDYGEWLDEGTTALIEDVAARAEGPTAGRPVVAVPRSDCGIEIRHDRAQQMYSAEIGDEHIGYLTYKFVGNRVALWTTMVVPAYRKHGVATELVAAALDDVRSTGKKVTVICPVVREVIDHYPQYADLVDDVHPGVTTSAGTTTQHARTDEREVPA